jgi:hypothetical protein
MSFTTAGLFLRAVSSACPVVVTPRTEVRRVCAQLRHLSAGQTSSAIAHQCSCYTPLRICSTLSVQQIRRSAHAEAETTRTRVLKPAAARRDSCASELHLPACTIQPNRVFASAFCTRYPAVHCVAACLRARGPYVQIVVIELHHD